MRSDLLPRAGVAVLLAGATLGAAGCGSDDKKDAKDAAQQFITLGSHPTAKFCDILSQHFIEERTQLKGEAAVKRCQVNTDKAGAANKGAKLPPGLKLGDAKVTGSKADVSATAPGLPTGTLHLIKEGGKWKVDSTSG
jgi:hypothetical protein